MKSLLRLQAERRFSDIALDQIHFLERFDRNHDGVVDGEEEERALELIEKEIQNESERLETIDDELLKQGEVIAGKYRIVQHLGSGSQSQAYAAVTLEEDQLVLLKQLRLSHLNSWDNYDAFVREKRVLEILYHPRIPTGFGSFEETNNGKLNYFSTQRFLPGRTLSSEIEAGQLFEEKLLKNIALQMLNILTHIHERGILHRDIKPSNMLRDKGGEIYLIDFGAVQFTNSATTLAIGTPGYMPPEQLIGAALPASDLYSLGITLIQLATRMHPNTFQLRCMRLHWRPFASLGKDFCDWLDTMISPEKEDRFSSAQEAQFFLKKGLKKTTESTKVKALELTEIIEGKPDTPIKIWRSFDQFICTFPPLDNELRKSLESILFASTFKTVKIKIKREIIKYGGGFSINGSGALKLNIGKDPGETKYEGRKLIALRTPFLKTGHYAIEAVFDTNKFYVNPIGFVLTSSFIIILSAEELEWVEGQIRDFATMNGFLDNLTTSQRRSH